MKFRFTLAFSLFFLSPFICAQEENVRISTEPANEVILEKILSSQKLIELSYAQLIKMRCNRFLVTPGKIVEKFYIYGRGDVSLNPDWACTKVSKDLIKALNFHQEEAAEDGDAYFIRLVFKKKLIELMGSAKTSLVLKNMQAKIRSDYFNFYDAAYEILQDKHSTIEFLAVLFQDYSNQKLHYIFLTKYAERATTPLSLIFSENMALLDKILNRLPYMNTNDQVYDSNGQLVYRITEFYPAKSMLNLTSTNSKGYHYWVPAYVASLLSRKMGNSDVHSYLAAFSFNYFYETLFREDLKLNSWATIKQILSLQDLPIGNIGSAYDVYMAHEGPIFALGYSVNDSKWPPEKFVKQIMIRPFPAYNAAIQRIRY